MKDKLTGGDIVWSYLAKTISLASGLITLPLILHYLSQEEIALNYILLTIMSIVILFDMGFSAQFSRNFAFVFGGGQDIEEKGFTDNVKKEVNYHTLYVLIKSAKWIYFILSTIMTIALLIGGTLYVYKFTNGFSLINNCLLLWLAFLCSVVIDFYYKFYTPLLMGENLIKEVNQIEVYSTFLKLVVLSVVILIGGGLWAIVLGNAAKIILARYMSKKFFYTEFIKNKLKELKTNYTEVKIATKKLWYNAKRLSIVRFSTYLATQLGLFLSGLYLSKQDVASFGLLGQLMGIMSSVAVILNNSFVPLYSTLRVSNNKQKLYRLLSLSLGSFYLFYLLGSFFLFVCINPLLILIRSNAHMPALTIVVIYFIYKFLEDQHCICSIYLTTKNVIVDRHSSPIIGFFVAGGLFFILNYSNLGLLGVVIVQLFVPLCYPNWKWPWEVCKEFNVSYQKLVKDSIKTTCLAIKKLNIN